MITVSTGAQHRLEEVGKLTGVSRNSGWGFGAVELYCWWNTGGSWTHTHTYTIQTPGWEVGERIYYEGENRGRWVGRQDEDDRQKLRQ